MARPVSVVPKLWHGLRRLERRELTWLILGLGACLALWAFIALAGEVMDGDTQALDTRILLALRDPIDPSRRRSGVRPPVRRSTRASCALCAIRWIRRGCAVPRGSKPRCST